MMFFVFKVLVEAQMNGNSEGGEKRRESSGEREKLGAAAS